MSTSGVFEKSGIRDVLLKCYRYVSYLLYFFTVASPFSIP